MSDPAADDHRGGLIVAVSLADAAVLPPDAAVPVASPDHPVWLHFDRRDPGTLAWLRTRSGLDPLVIDGLVTESTRPRVTPIGEGVLITVRGVNLNPGADPEDMISIRVFAERSRVLSLRGPRLLAIEAIIEAYNQGRGPRTVGSLLVAMVTGLTDRMGPVVEQIGETLDELEDRVIDPTRSADRLDLIRMRQRVITLHRYLAPQAHALANLLDEGAAWLDAGDRRALREQINRVTRYVEDLDAAKSRSGVIQDEYANQLAERANNRIYAVTIIAAVFLPLTLVSGLLGMNVGGIPLGDHPRGFLIVNGVLGALGLLGFWLLRRRRWL